MKKGTGNTADATLLPQISVGPKGLVVVDLNDTLITEEGAVITVATTDLIEAVRAAERSGWTVGLCSDSPYGPLKDWGHRHGITGPVLGENGQMFNGVPLGRFNTNGVRVHVRTWCANNDVTLLKRTALAREFGGYKPDRAGVAFGGGRACSVSIFAYVADGGLDPPLTARLGEYLRSLYGEAADVAPEAGFIAVHCDADFRQMKGRILRLLGSHLKAEGKGLVMIGNSVSDLIRDSELGTTMMVANATANAKELAERVLTLPYTSGVIEALQLVSHAQTD